MYPCPVQAFLILKEGGRGQARAGEQSKHCTGAPCSKRGPRSSGYEDTISFKLQKLLARHRGISGTVSQPKRYAQSLIMRVGDKGSQPKIKKNPQALHKKTLPSASAKTLGFYGSAPMRTQGKQLLASAFCCAVLFSDIYVQWTILGKFSERKLEKSFDSTNRIA